MKDCKEDATPIATSCLMDADEAGQQVDSTKYRALIGSLLYLTASRPKIWCLLVCKVSIHSKGIALQSSKKDSQVSERDN